MRVISGYFDSSAAARCAAALVLLSASAFAGPNGSVLKDRLIAAGWSEGVAERITDRLVTARGRVVAVFDHDGTLMSGDVTEGSGKQPGMMRTLIEEHRCRPPGLACIPPGMRADPWTAYKAWTDRDPMRAYAWLPTLLAGFQRREVEELAARRYRDCYQHYLFPEMLELLSVLRQANVEIWIVSASAQPLVEPAALYTGVPREHILGIRLKTEGGVILPALEQPISFAAGKVWYIQNLVRPRSGANLLVFGDSYRTDGPMLRFAAREGGVGVLVNPAAGLVPVLERAGVQHQTFASRGALVRRADAIAGRSTAR